MSVGNTSAYLDFMAAAFAAADHYDDQQLLGGNDMGRYAQDPGGNFTPPPVGTHVARCYSIIDIGSQRGDYLGQPSVRNTILVGWEVPDELMDDGRPFVASKFYRNSLNEKATLRAHLEAWRGRGFSLEELQRFDLEAIVSKPCLLTIINDSETHKHKIASVSGLPKGAICPPQVNPSFTFWLDSFAAAKFATLSDGLKKMIEKSDEYQTIARGHGPATATASAPSADFDDDIPF
jgi:hypothetical protein